MTKDSDFAIQCYIDLQRSLQSRHLIECDPSVLETHLSCLGFYPTLFYQISMNASQMIFQININISPTIVTRMQIALTLKDHFTAPVKLDSAVMELTV